MLGTLFVIDTIAKQRQEQLRTERRERRHPRVRTR